MQQENYRKSAFTAILGSGLAAAIIALSSSSSNTYQTKTIKLKIFGRNLKVKFCTLIMCVYHATN